MGRVLLRRVGLAAALERLPSSQPSDWLTAEETVRLDAMRSLPRRSQFVAGHWLARELATQLSGGKPARWRWQRSNGEPARVIDGDRTVFVSISHSGDELACAASLLPVGLDIEAGTKARDWLAIAGEAFSAAECSELAALSGAALVDRFRLFWTIKEATGKRLGGGLQLEQSRRQRPVGATAMTGEVVTWLFPGSVMALAYDGAAIIDAVGINDAKAQAAWRIETAR